MSLDDDLGFPEEELERLFADALAGQQAPMKSSETGRPKRATKQSPPLDLDELEITVMDGALNGDFDAVPLGDDSSGKFHDLDRQLAMALDDDDEALSLRREKTT